MFKYILIKFVQFTDYIDPLKGGHETKPDFTNYNKVLYSMVFISFIIFLLFIMLKLTTLNT